MSDASLESLLARYDRPPADLRPNDLPRVVVNMVLTIDGRSAVEGRAGPLSSPADHALFAYLRGLADVILVGAGTVRAEGYGPVRLDDDVRARRVAAGRSPTPRLAIVSRSLELPERTLAVSPSPIVLTVAASDAARRAVVAAQAEVVVVGEHDVDLPAALAALRDRGVDVVLCEGGEDLNNALVHADLVDEWCITVAPVLGGDPLGLAGTGFGVHHLELLHAAAAGDHLFLRYRRRRGSGGGEGSDG